MGCCRSDPTNTNVYIGNISPELTEADIRRHFSSYGHVVDIKLHKKGGYGFVRYQKHSDAVNAILQTRGQTLTGKVMKCSWGKHPDIPTGRSMVMALQAPLAPLSPLGSGEQVVQSLLPAQYGTCRPSRGCSVCVTRVCDCAAGMLPSGMSPMTSQNLMLTGFPNQVPMSPAQQGQLSMLPRSRATARVGAGGVSTPLAGYYPPVYY